MTKPEYIDVIFKTPHGRPLSIAIKNDLESLQALVGGYIELPAYTNLDLPSNMDVIVNEEGLLLGLSENVPLPNTHGGVLLGNVIFVRSDSEGEFVGLEEGDLERVQKALGL